jgi:hypothetical protein
LLSSKLENIRFDGNSIGRLVVGALLADREAHCCVMFLREMFSNRILNVERKKKRGNVMLVFAGSREPYPNVECLLRGKRGKKSTEVFEK